MSADPVTTADRDTVGAELREQLAAVLGSQVDVEQHDRRPRALDRRLGLRQRRGLAHREALELEVDPDEDANRRVVVDDERAETPFHCGDANDYDLTGDGSDRHEPGLRRGAR